MSLRCQPSCVCLKSISWMGSVCVGGGYEGRNAMEWYLLPPIASVYFISTWGLRRNDWIFLVNFHINDLNLSTITYFSTTYVLHALDIWISGISVMTRVQSGGKLEPHCFQNWQIVFCPERIITSNSTLSTQYITLTNNEKFTDTMYVLRAALTSI